MSESKKDLLPCPFCGDGNARLEEGDYGQMVSCHPRSGCGAVTGYYETETEAAEAWNRRALADTQPRLTVEEARARMTLTRHVDGAGQNDVHPTESTAKAVQRPAVDVRWPDAPARIYLQVCADGEECGESYAWHRREAADADGLTWCEDKINDTDLEYVRADRAETQRSSSGARSDEKNPVAQPKKRSTALTEPLLARITLAAADCERCIRKDWGAAAKDELMTIRNAVIELRAALSHREERSTALTRDEVLAVADARFPRWREDIQERFVLELAEGWSAALSHRSRPEPESLSSDRASAEAVQRLVDGERE